MQTIVTLVLTRQQGSVRKTPSADILSRGSIECWFSSSDKITHADVFLSLWKKFFLELTKDSDKTLRNLGSTVKPSLLP